MINKESQMLEKEKEIQEKMKAPNFESIPSIGYKTPSKKVKKLKVKGKSSPRKMRKSKTSKKKKKRKKKSNQQSQNKSTGGNGLDKLSPNTPRSLIFHNKFSDWQNQNLLKGFRRLSRQDIRGAMKSARGARSHRNHMVSTSQQFNV